MPTTDNGWPASPSLPIRPFVIAGVAFVPGLADNDDVHTVLGYVLTQFHERVEPLHAGWCWGFAYRANVNSPNSLSRHSGGIAVDANAPAHPNGVPTAHTFSAKQIDEVHQILDEVAGAVRWGGDYNGNPDAMHFEINVTAAQLAPIALRVRQIQEDAMPYRDWPQADRNALLEDVANAVLAAQVDKRGTVRDALAKSLGLPDLVRRARDSVTKAVADLAASITKE